MESKQVWSGFKRWPGSVFLGKTPNLIVPLYTQEYKWVPVNCQGNLLANHPGE